MVSGWPVIESVEVVALVMWVPSRPGVSLMIMYLPGELVEAVGVLLVELADHVAGRDDGLVGDRHGLLVDAEGVGLEVGRELGGGIVVDHVEAELALGPSGSS